MSSLKVKKGVYGAEIDPAHRRFADEYLVDHNGAAAARRAGLVPETVEPIKATQAAHRVLKRGDVQAYLQERIKQASDKRVAKAERVLEELTRLGIQDPAAAFDPTTGELLNPKDMPEDIRRAISGFEVIVTRDNESGETTTRYKVKFWPKDRGLELLGKHHKLFTDVVEHKGLEGLGERLDAARKRTGR